MAISFITWNIDPVFFRVGNISVHWYSILMATGFILGYFVIRKIFIKEKIPVQTLDSFGIFIVLGMFVGGRLVHCLFYEADYYLKFPLDIIKPWKGELGNGAVYTGYRGLASHGGVLGVVIGLSINAYRKNLSVLWILDRFAIVLALAGCFIRLGNLFNSEILGVKSTLPWAFIFEQVSGIPRHPVQLYEALSYLAIFFFTYRYYKFRINRLRKGEILSLTLILVFIIRVLFEFIKEGQTSADNHTLLKMGQLLSIPFIIIGASLFIVMKLKPTKE